MPISKLQKEQGGSNRWVMMDPNSYLRAIAIILVVLDHVSPWGLRGGAPILTILVGYNVARFQAKALFSGQVGLVGRSLANNLSLYFLALAVWFIYRGGISLNHILLVSNIFAPQLQSWSVSYNEYWFIEAYMQIMALLIGVFAIPWIRNRVSARPFLWGAGAFALSIGALFGWRQTWTMPWNSCSVGQCYPVPETAFLVVAGWCLYFAKSLTSKILTAAVATTALILIWGGPLTLWPIIVSLIPLATQARVPAPAPVARVLSTIAAYSYAIYLFHLMPFTWLLENTTLGQTSKNELSVASIVLGFSLGFAGQWLFDAARRSSLVSGLKLATRDS